MQQAYTLNLVIHHTYQLRIIIHLFFSEINIQSSLRADILQLKMYKTWIKLHQIQFY